MKYFLHFQEQNMILTYSYSYEHSQIFDNEQFYEFEEPWGGSVRGWPWTDNVKGTVEIEYTLSHTLSHTKVQGYCEHVFSPSSNMAVFINAFSYTFPPVYPSLSAQYNIPKNTTFSSWITQSIKTNGYPQIGIKRTGYIAKRITKYSFQDGYYLNSFESDVDYDTITCRFSNDLPLINVYPSETKEKTLDGTAQFRISSTPYDMEGTAV